MRCPVDPAGKGSHQLTTEGYDPARCGVVHRCPCGYVWVFPTDEMLAS